MKDTKILKFKLYTYDVMGNAKDGFEVNDRCVWGEIAIKCKAAVYNVGTPQEFKDYSPTDLQLSRAVGGRGLAWDGETDFTLYAEYKRNGRPACELVRVKE